MHANTFKALTSTFSILRTSIQLDYMLHINPLTM